MTSDSWQKPNASAIRKLNEERDDRALRLRESGLRYTEIAHSLDVTVSAAHKAVTRALARSTPVVDRDTYREMEISRMDTLLSRVWPMAFGKDATNDEPAVLPDLEAVATVLRISAHKMRLLGLNREPSVDFEAEIRKAAIAAGEDPDEAVKEALAVLRGFEGRRGKGGLMLVGG